MKTYTKTMLCAILGVVMAGLSSTAFADEDQIKLKDGPGRDKVLANCTMCHSVDYVPMNSPFMKKAAWQGTVNKMVRVMGAPISQDDIPQIVEYLTKYYGVE